MSGLLPKLKFEFKKKLENNHSLKIPDDWLSQCAEFIVEEFPGKQINEYIDLIFKQLLDYDLKVIGTECLPAQVFNSDNGTLNGVFLLQLIFCTDLTQSYFSQIQKLRGIISENAMVDADNVPTATQFEKKDKKNRLMSMFLTDGKSEIKVVEIKTISFLSDELLPGTKIELRGKISYQNGVFFIGPENVNVLGGTVEELSNLDSLINIIENEISAKNEDTPARREKTATFDTSNNSRTGTQNSKAKIEKITQPSQAYSNNFASKSSNYNNKPSSKFANIPDSDDDELLMNCDFNSYGMNSKNQDQKTQNRNNFTNRYSNVKQDDITPLKRPPSTETISNYNKSTNQNTLLKKQKVEDIIELDDDEMENDFKTFQTNKNQNYRPNNPNQYDEDIELLDIDETDLVTNKQMNSIKNQPSRNMNTLKELNGSKQQNQTSNSIKLSALLEKSFLDSCCKNNKPYQTNAIQNLSICMHQIKGFFKQVTSPLTQVKLRWHQEILFSDGLDDLICYLDDEPLANLLELTCREAKELFKKARETGDTEYSLKFERKRKNCENKLRTINAMANFKYDFDKNKFCIFKLDILDFNRTNN